MKKKISERTKLIVFCYASNSPGTINNVKRIVKWAKGVEALPYLEAVQYAPHGFINVKKLIVTSSSVAPINFLDRILLILYCKRKHLDRLRAYKITPEKDYPSFKWETGAQKP
ncbi:MAG: aminotransferase class V-fold PLP-dependent enzyme [Candidatus Aminicenantia bacterium]